jgi:Methylamine utilization protein MauJ
MWFPYSLPTAWKVEGDRQGVNESQADNQSREFLVAVQLRNPVLREWSVELQLAEPKLVMQAGPGGEVISIGYFPDENNRLAEITCKLTDTNARDAASKSYALVSNMLSAWSAEHGRGFAIGGLRVADLKHNARWRVIPHWPSALEFRTPVLTGLPKEFWPMASLYREGRTSGSDRYRFLCCESILISWRRGDPPFPIRVKRRKKPPPHGECLRVTQELMALSGMNSFTPELEGTPFKDLPERLKPWHRAAVAFMLEGDGDDGTESLTRTMEWAAVANLVDLAAYRVLSRTVGKGREADAEPLKRQTAARAGNSDRQIGV